MATYFVLWMLIVNGDVSFWHVMRTHASRRDCEEQLAYLEKSLRNNTLKCLPSGTKPVKG
jgi:hypothetical protein